MKILKITIPILSGLAVIISTIFWLNENLAVMATSPDAAIEVISKSGNLSSTAYELKEYDDRIEWIKYETDEIVEYVHIYYIENDVVVSEKLKCVFAKDIDAKYRVDRFKQYAEDIKIIGNILQGNAKCSDMLGLTKTEVINQLALNSSTYMKIEQTN